MPDTWPEDELPPPPTKTAAPRPATIPPPPAIDGYEVGEPVGRGGMAVVYRARQKSLNRPVALKVLLVGPYADPAERARIRAEAESIARLQHPNVVHVYEVGEAGGLPYLLMEFVDGGTLADQLRAGPVPPRQAAEWVEDIARGVHAAHRRGVVHRDLKPANVLMTSDGVPKITDFGIARRLDDPADRTRTGLVVGTPAYMAPEQAAGKKGVGPPADVWALGAILYELLAGRPPFAGESSLDTLHRVGSEAVTPPSRLRPNIPPALEAICLKCLRKDPAERYASAEAVADDLARARTELARPSPAARSARRWLVPAAGAAGVVLVGLLLVKYAGGPGAPPNGDPPGKPGLPTPAATTNGAAADLPVKAGAPRWERFVIAEDDETFEHLAFPTRRTGYAASKKGVYRTDNEGDSWKQVWAQELPGAFFLRFEGADRGWLGADQLYETADGGTTWKAVRLPGVEQMSEVRALAAAPDGLALAGGAAPGGELTLFRRRSDRAGWEKLAPVEARLPDGGTQAYRDWWLGGLAAAGARDGWALLNTRSGREEGVVVYTPDGGGTWETVFRADTYLRHVHFADAKRGWLAGLNGKLWATADGGRTWSEQDRPFREAIVNGLAFGPGGDPFGLVLLLNGQLLRTDDGTDWLVVPVQLDGPAAVAVAVVDGGRAYVLGTGGRGARYTDPRGDRP